MGGTRLLVACTLIGTLMTACADSHSAECMPYEQFRLNGSLYFGPSEDIATDQLARQVGAVTKPLPSGAVRCEPFTLTDGQGTPTPGSKVYAVKSMDPATALAVVDSATGKPRLYRMRPTPP